MVMCLGFYESYSEYIVITEMVMCLGSCESYMVVGCDIGLDGSELVFILS